MGKNSYGFLDGFLKSKTFHDIELESGINEKLIDTDGKKYIDFNSGLWNVSLGYNQELNQNIKTAFINILNTNLPFVDITSYNHVLYNTVSKKLLEFTKKSELDRVIFTSSGSESIEASLKICRTIGYKNKVASFSNSYHGTFYGDMSISGLTQKINRAKKVDYSNVLLLDFPQNEQDEDIFFNKIIEYKNELGAMFIEPVIGSGGIYFKSPKFYNKLVKLCQELDIITIFDEIATGFYKTGDRFFINKLDVTPDIICLSKSINNGTLPAGAILIQSWVSEKLENSVIEHMSTQNGNLLAISAINETLDYYYNNDQVLINNVNLIEKKTKQTCLKKEIDIRAIGAMIAIPINKKNIFPLVHQLRKSGIIVYMYITDSEVGLTLFPNINIDINIFEKSLNYIIKRVKKYELS